MAGFSIANPYTGKPNYPPPPPGGTPKLKPAPPKGGAFLVLTQGRQGQLPPPQR